MRADASPPRATTLDDAERVRSRLLASFEATRATTASLTASLTADDCMVQAMPDASPTKWHLAHTSWFFDTFLLADRAGYEPYHPAFRVLYNSYYNAVGEQHPRPQRGLVSRPTLEEVRAYRGWTDERVLAVLQACSVAELERLRPLVELGVAHEQQHQELILMDIKVAFGSNPLRPAYRDTPPPEPAPASAQSFVGYPEGLREIGHGGGGFAFDNEGPRHRVFVPAFRLASRLTTNREMLEFIVDGGYTRPELWLSDGWAALVEQRWRAPMYWEQRDGAWWHMTLGGMRPLALEAPVCHVSFFEADAFARWTGMRLPREAEWEAAASELPVEGNFLDSGALAPRPHPGAEPEMTAASSPTLASSPTPAQMFGDVWEWTASAYAAYPGYRPAAGALGEYNAKFMSSQMVLRGGACVTPAGHVRPTYRNFFPPSARWAFAGIRLAADA